MVDQNHGPHDDPETLRELYHDRAMTMVEIAEEFDVSTSAIDRAFDRHDIERRTPEESRALRGTDTTAVDLSQSARSAAEGEGEGE